MDAIESLKQLDPWAMFCGVLVVLIAWSFLQGLWEKTVGALIKKTGLETKAMRQKREDHENLEAVMKLAKTTAENLDKLQKRHLKDEEEFRNNLNDYMEESRKDRKALHDEMIKFSNNRISDRAQSLQIQKELKESIQDLIDEQKVKDDKIETLTSLFVDKEIEDLRWTILDFTASLSEGKKYNREAFDQVMRMYHRYERILDEHNMENGLVEESVKFIQEMYHDKLKHGFN